MAGDPYERGEAVFRQLRRRLHDDVSRMFRLLLVGQWVFAIAVVLARAPFSAFHFQLVLGLGAVINALPLLLIQVKPGWWLTRHVVACAQILWSIILITVTDGRIETHFHVFGSLAFLAFYRDWRVLVTASLMVAGDQLIEGLAWPDSIYAIANPAWYRFLEHGFWVAFEDLFLIWHGVHSLRDMRGVARREAGWQLANERTEATVAVRTRELAAAADRYKSLVENTAAMPFEYDRVAKRFAYIAPQAARLFDCSALDLQRGAIFGALVHVDDRARLKTSLGKPSADPVDFRVQRRDGKIVHTRMFLGERGGVLLDITRQTQLEEELRHAQKLESVGRLAAGVAHEINTPIQFVGDSVQFIGDAVTELLEVVKQHPHLAPEIDLAYLVDRLPDALQRASDGTQRVAKIVRSMKIFAHPLRAEMAEVDLNLAIESTLTVARNEYRYVADVELALGELPRVMCHAGEINQVLLNLIVNAADAIRETSRRGTIRVESRREGDEVVIMVEDTGGGIPVAIRERIFEPFFTTKEVGRGTGQGLAIARSVIVDKHKGQLTFESRERGTAFSIRLPLQQAVARAA